MAFDPAATEAFWGLALELNHQHQTRATFVVLGQALEHEQRWHFALPHPQLTVGNFRHQFAELYENLRHHLNAEAPPAPQRLLEKPPKVGRNDPCPCGSGKKFKRCCGG